MNQTNKLIKLGIVGVGITASLLNISDLIAQPSKHVAVAPEHIALQKIPGVESKGIFSHSTMLPIMARDGFGAKSAIIKSSQSEEHDIYMDGTSDSPIVLLSPNSEQWLMTVTDPNGKAVYLKIENIQIGQQYFKGKQFVMQTPVVGNWKVKLTRKEGHQLEQQITTEESAGKNQKPDAYLLFKGDPEFKLYSYVDNNFTVQDSELNIVAQLVNSGEELGNRQLMLKKKPLTGYIQRAYATITSPSDKRTTVFLRDDGLKGDKLAGDGLYTGTIPSDEVGTYTSQVQIEGIRPDGLKFSRTATDLYPVAPLSFEFTEEAAKLIQVDENTARLSVPVNQLGESESVFMAAEVWGTNPDGELEAAAWAGGIVQVNSAEQKTMLELNFDTRWLSRSNLQAPFSLKSLRLQTVDNNVPLTELESLQLNAITPLSITSSANIANKGALTKEKYAITNDMLMGKAPAQQKFSIQASGSKLLLVHGYCSGSVWKTSDFSNSAEFQDYNQNRSHDQFAQQVMNFGSAYSSYGIVAHSQGGAAALQIYTKYWSGLDNATGGRIIQSVGTPYQGTALAGNLAVLGDIFGAGCGTNTDLTYSGAANWLSTIPSWARNQVDYYTTSFNTRWWAYDYCHLATDLFLDDPEDGTTEKWSGQLSGGVNKGHKKGWCHTNGMRDTAQYKDSSRNSSMNSRAAR